MGIKRSKTMNNREWLESLSNEEFAKKVLGGNRCDLCDGRNGKRICNVMSVATCIRHHIKWLKAEHKGDKQ